MSTDIFPALRIVVLLSLLTIAAVTDLTEHRVSNHVIAAGFAAESFVHILSHPVIESEALGASLVFAAALFAVFVLRLMGGADVKLYSLCIFTYPNETGFRIICLSMVLAAVYAVYTLIRYDLLSDRLALLIRCAAGLSAGPHGFITGICTDSETLGNTMQEAERGTLHSGSDAAGRTDMYGYAETVCGSGNDKAMVPMAVFISAGTFLTVIA